MARRPAIGLRSYKQKPRHQGRGCKCQLTVQISRDQRLDRLGMRPEQPGAVPNCKSDREQGADGAG